MPRYSVKVFPGVRVYGGSSRRKQASLLSLVIAGALVVWVLVLNSSHADNVPSATTTTISTQSLIVGSVLQSESGNASSPPFPPNFTVPSSAKGWILEWSFGGKFQGGYPGFTIDVSNPQLTTQDLGPYFPDSSSGSGSDRYYDTGTFYLEITSGYHFSYVVRTLLASS